MMLTHHKLTKQRHEVLLKGIAFMHRYLALRRNSLPVNVVQLADAAVAKTHPAFTTAKANASTTVEMSTTPTTPFSSTESSRVSSPAPVPAPAPAPALPLDEKGIYELALYQETLYNLGRAFHDMRLLHLATDQYQQALALATAYPELAQNAAFVTTQAAHNLVLVYKHSGATNLAFEVMQQFLVI